MVLLDVVPGTLFLKTLDSNRYLAIPLELLESVPGTASLSPCRLYSKIAIKIPNRVTKKVKKSKYDAIIVNLHNRNKILFNSI